MDPVKFDALGKKNDSPVVLMTMVVENNQLTSLITLSYYLCGDTKHFSTQQDLAFLKNGRKKRSNRLF